MGQIVHWLGIKAILLGIFYVRQFTNLEMTVEKIHRIVYKTIKLQRSLTKKKEIKHICNSIYVEYHSCTSQNFISDDQRKLKSYQRFTLEFALLYLQGTCFLRTIISL